MSRLLYAWELGDNLGHVGPFEPVLSALEKRGHEVLLAARDTGACARLLGARGNWVQAPLVAERQISEPPINYADLLLRFGYDDPAALLGLLAAWRQLLWLAQPELVLADHAPTALLAARSLGMSAMLFGSGFHVPPLRDPFPSLRPWQSLPDTVLAGCDAKALRNINLALTTLGCAPLSRLSDMFAVVEDALLTLPELDHYPERGPARYWGVIPASGANHSPPWPGGKGRIFAYLRRGNPHYRHALAALAQSGCAVVAYLPDQGTKPDDRLPANITVSREPLDLARLAREADIALLHAGAASVTAFLLAGKPVLCLPNHLEQYLTAVRIQSMGAGLLIAPDADAALIAKGIARLIEEPSHGLAARGFAAKYAHLDQDTVVAHLVERIESLCPGAKQSR